jgi:RNA polymerase sigma factor (sigma-70 family)
MATKTEPQQEQALSQAGVIAALDLHSQGGAAADRACGQLFQMLWPVLRRRFMRWGLREALAEEVASDAVLKVLAGLGGVRDHVAFIQWSGTVARNTFLDHVRSSRAANDHEVFVDEDGWQSVWAGVEDPAQLDHADRLCLQRQLDAFCKAHPDRALVLEQIALEGWTVDEAAEALGRTAAGAKEYLSQCRKRLMGYLRVCLVGDDA